MMTEIFHMVCPTSRAARLLRRCNVESQKLVTRTMYADEATEDPATWRVSQDYAEELLSFGSARLQAVWANCSEYTRPVPLDWDGWIVLDVEAPFTWPFRREGYSDGDRDAAREFMLELVHRTRSLRSRAKIAFWQPPLKEGHRPWIWPVLDECHGVQPAFYMSRAGLDDPLASLDREWPVYAERLARAKEHTGTATIATVWDTWRDDRTPAPLEVCFEQARRLVAEGADALVAWNAGREDDRRLLRYICGLLAEVS